MKENKNSQLSIVLNVVLIIAVITLFVLHFSDKKVDTDIAPVVSENNITEEATADSIAVMPLDFTIAYVNTDSLWSQYKFVKEALVKLENSENQMKSQLDGKAKKLQDDYEKYVRQGKAGMLTLQQQKDTEEMLTKQQQDGVELEQRMSQQLMIQKQEVNNQLTDTIISFLNRYRIEHNYTLILQYGYSSGLLSATPELDVTYDVIKRLNAKYDFEINH